MSDIAADLLRRMYKTPSDYVTLPMEIREKYPQLACAALRNGNYEKRHSIYAAVPERHKEVDFFEEETTSLSFLATSSSCKFSLAAYALVPASVKEGRWDLVDHCAPFSSCVIEPKLLTLMPPRMAQCYIHFWQHATQCYHPWPCGSKNDFFKEKYALVTADELPHLTLSEAEAWLRQRPDVGYAMLPLHTKLAFPELTRRFLLSEWVKPAYLKMVPLRDPDLFMEAIERHGASFYKYVPLEIRKSCDDMAEHLLLDGFWGREDFQELKERVMPYVPAVVWQRHGNDWLATMCANVPVLYFYLPRETMLLHPELALPAMLQNPFFYPRLPEESKRGRWDLATLALESDPHLYHYIPLEMRDMEQAPEEDKERVVELARLATRAHNDFWSLRHRPHTREEVCTYIIHFHFLFLVIFRIFCVLLFWRAGTSV